MKPQVEEKFSVQLTSVFAAHKQIHLSSLNKLFGEKAFAMAFLLLLLPSALPLPTGGITHFFQIIAMLIGLEMVAGRPTIWIPLRWAKRSIRSPKEGKGLGRFIVIIRFFERFSRVRGASTLNQTVVVRLLGLVLILFTAIAFVAPPFSGLDTLPALGVVIISMGIILEDIVVVLIGIAIGVVGAALVYILAGSIFFGLHKLFEHSTKFL